MGWRDGVRLGRAGAFGAHRNRARGRHKALYGGAAKNGVIRLHAARFSRFCTTQCGASVLCLLVAATRRPSRQLCAGVRTWARSPAHAAPATTNSKATSNREGCRAPISPSSRTTRPPTPILSWRLARHPPTMPRRRCTRARHTPTSTRNLHWRRYRSSALGPRSNQQTIGSVPGSAPMKIPTKTGQDDTLSRHSACRRARTWCRCTSKIEPHGLRQDLDLGPSLSKPGNRRSASSTNGEPSSKPAQPHAEIYTKPV